MAHLESYFVEPEWISGDRVVFAGEELHHLRKVRRKRPGDTVAATDGRGNFFTVRLAEFTADRAVGEIVKRRRLVGEPLLSVTLAQGIIRSQRMDWLVEKATELGARAVIPVVSRYSVAGSSEIKLNRWRRLAKSAVKQCGRSVLPEIAGPVELRHLAELLPGPVLFAHPGTRRSVADVLSERARISDLRSVSLLVGPEGGFGEEEVAQLLDWGFHQVHLGGRRLRSETAAVTMITLALQAAGEL